MKTWTLRYTNHGSFFSNWPFGVKRFQIIRHYSVDVAHGLAFLFGFGTKALVWGFFLSMSFRAAHLSSSVSLFDLKARFFVPTRASFTPARAGTVKVRRRTNLAACSALARPHLDGFEHDGTLGTLGAVGMTIRGEPACGALVAPQPCIRQSCA